jgi:hypothetical protein
MPNDVDINTFKTEGNYEYSYKYKKNKFPNLYDNNNNFDFSYPLSSRNNNDQYLRSYNSNNINYDSINNLKENYSYNNLHLSNSANNVNSENKILTTVELELTNLDGVTTVGHFIPNMIQTIDARKAYRYIGMLDKRSVMEVQKSSWKIFRF